MPLTQANADPAPGQVEEWTIPTGNEWRQYELATGQDGYVWYLQGITYAGNAGLVEGISKSSPPIRRTFGPHALPVDIARGPDGDMWVTEQHNGTEPEEHDTIGRIGSSPAAELTEFSIGGPPIPHDVFVGPVGIASGPDGNLWFTDSRESFIGEMNTAGDVVARHFVPTGEGIDEASNPYLRGIAAGREGSVWFLDSGRNSRGQNLVGRVNPDGTIEEFPIPSLGAEPQSIAAGPDDSMWFSEPGVDRIGRVTESGEVSEVNAPGVSYSLKALAEGPEGNLWFPERLPFPGFGSISPDGELRSYTPTFEPLDPLDEGDSVGPDALVLGSDGLLWFTDPRPDIWYPEKVSYNGTTDVGRFAIPVRPQSIGAPSITGTPVVGESLTTSSGTWANSPTAESIQWQRCVGASASPLCADIPGESGINHVVASSDIGNRLRTVITASNEAGSTPVASSLIGPVAAVSPGKQTRATRIPVAGSTITAHLVRERGRVVVRAMMLHGLHRGSTVTLLCHGPGCRLATSRSGSRQRPGEGCHSDTGCRLSVTISRGPRLDLTRVASKMALARGASLIIVVTRPGMLGRAFEFKVGSQGVPGPVLTCRALGSVEERAKC